jgi:DNA repair protein RadD
MLRDYQQRSIDQLYDWIANNAGNPCLVLPTGSGKSHIIAALCKDALQTWPETRILMLTHQKELIEQNAEKMLHHWPDAPLGIYSASVGIKQLGEPITFAGIQSVRSKASELGHADLIIIDEAHTVSHKDEGGYRKLIADLKTINPALRVVGLTATPFRLGHGLITDRPAIFDALLEPVSIEELVFKGYLATLRSKVTGLRLDTNGVRKRGGEFIESELQAAVDTDKNNLAVVDEVVRIGAERRSWLFFCAGVKHAENVAFILNTIHGIPAACVTGETPKKERERLLDDFKSGKIRALTNANVLTTGFDYPGIDLIAMLRPTLSPGLYVQMAGRGMRIAEGKTDCLVLDFAGVVAAHGPITAVQPPKKAGDGNGEVPIKICDNCDELCHLSVRECPACGHAFPEPERKKLKLHNNDIMGLEGSDLDVTSWNWRKHISKASGKEMLAVTYYAALSDPPVTEYLPIMHDGYAGQKSVQLLAKMAHDAFGMIGPEVANLDGLDQIAKVMNSGNPPRKITYKQDGKFCRVINRSWTA